MLHSMLSDLIDLAHMPRAVRSRPAAEEAPVLIRRAAGGDEREIERLSALDEQELPPGERLIAEVGGRPVAAVDVRSGIAVADPFVPTRAVVELLGLRAAQVRG